MPVTFAFFSGPLPWAILAVLTIAFLWVDLHFFARGREPSFREALLWSIGWLVVSLLAVIPVWLLEGGDDAVVYATVYLIARSPSLDTPTAASASPTASPTPAPRRARWRRRAV